MIYENHANFPVIRLYSNIFSRLSLKRGKNSVAYHEASHTVLVILHRPQKIEAFVQFVYH